jgi:hypothetical protein
MWDALPIGERWSRGSVESCKNAEQRKGEPLPLTLSYASIIPMHSCSDRYAGRHFLQAAAAQVARSHTKIKCLRFLVAQLRWGAYTAPLFSANPPIEEVGHHAEAKVNHRSVHDVPPPLAGKRD